MIIKVKVKPNSKKFSVQEGDPWIVSLTEPPENNRANLELIKEMSKLYGSCKIIKGIKSKLKTIEI
ncbi:MAG: DUF167 domain-containing protein [Candidatus Aenigmarchaeota archaeon]|nr:DUF167 domain-containing protein [Candidatus Aenigmarchaeota archaeon]